MKLIWYVQVEDNIVEWHCFQISKLLWSRYDSVWWYFNKWWRYCRLTLVKMKKVNMLRSASEYIKYWYPSEKRIIVFLNLTNAYEEVCTTILTLRQQIIFHFMVIYFLLKYLTLQIGIFCSDRSRNNGGARKCCQLILYGGWHDDSKDIYRASPGFQLQD